MNSTASLTALEICSIITTGAKFNLQRLKFGDLDICFGAYQPEPADETPPEPSTNQPNPGKQIDPQEEERILSDRIHQLQIEDPVLAEEMIASGDLVDDPDGDFDGEEA